MNQPPLINLKDSDFDEKNDNSIYKYLADVGLDPEEVKSWGKIGSLTEALKNYDESACDGCLIDDSLIEFVKNLPVGCTPRPSIRKVIQREPQI